MAGQLGGQLPMQGMHQHSPGNVSWDSQDYSGQSYTNGHDPDPNQQLAMGYLKGFPAQQKKTTRDGQIPKRRGPKPDSKPAQTRRQELNRQAQRTHRERKEQYIKALELELDRFKEVYVNDRNNADQVIKQQQQENAILRDIISSRGINVEEELSIRQAGMGMTVPIKRDASSLSPSQMPTRLLPQHQNYLGTTPSTAGYSPMSNHPYRNGSATISVGHSPGISHHSSPSGPGIQEFSIKQEHGGVPDMPGVFERDPQLAVDFILQLEHTCRDHGEYLVRRSVASGDDPEQAQISGHALMASTPSIRHVREVPPAQGGLVPTHAHRMNDAMNREIINNLEMLSSRAAEEANLMDGQVTPVAAMKTVRKHRYYHSLTADDIRMMVDEVKGNVRCYGFGAVMEDFELRDALDSVFATKPEAYEAIGNDYSGEIDDMYS